MYGGRGADVATVVSSGTIMGAGAVLLPSTGENVLATVLAYAAITLGILALVSQLSIRLIRKFSK